MHFAHLANTLLKDEESVRDDHVLPVKKSKSVKVWQNYGHGSVAPLFGPPCRRRRNQYDAARALYPAHDDAVTSLASTILPFYSLFCLCHCIIVYYLAIQPLKLQVCSIKSVVSCYHLLSTASITMSRMVHHVQTWCHWLNVRNPAREGPKLRTTFMRLAQKLAKIRHVVSKIYTYIFISPERQHIHNTHN